MIGQTHNYSYLQSLGNLSESDISSLQAADKCLRNNIPFVLFALPGIEHYTFFANPTGRKSDQCFLVVPWLQKYASAVRIYREKSAKDILNSNYHFDIHENDFPISTDKNEYLLGLKLLISDLQKTNGKTVISRVITEDNVHIDYISLAVRQFQCYHDTFRFMYFTPQTGAWLGTSPELLLDFDKESNNFSTMSLAGTRKGTIDEEWDDKNVIEQNYVAKYIAETLTERNISFRIKHERDVRFEPVTHICDVFSGNIENGDYIGLIDSLSPTPALCGFPLKDAVKHINKLEAHSRRCYGGYIAFETGRRFIAHVNLRCMNFGKTSYSVYAGGGITRNSIPEQEWNETENKCVTLLNNIELNKL